MDQSDLLDALLECINEFTGHDYVSSDVDPARPLNDYGIDSLNVLQILAAVEDALGIEIDLSELSESSMASIATLLEYLASLRDSAAESV
jgi:acyl carrier protein